MSKIDKLTPQQEIELVKWREKYLALGLSCEPIDKITTANSINKLYKLINKKEPKYIWVESPMAAQLLLNVLTNKKLQEKIFKDTKNGNLGSNLEGNLRSNLLSNLESNLRSNLRSNLEGNLLSNLWSNLWSNLRSNLEGNLLSNLESNLGSDNIKLEYIGTSFWGQQDLYWVAFYLFADLLKSNGLYDEKDREILQLWDNIGKSCMWFWPYENYCIVCDRPLEIHKNKETRLHNDKGMAVKFRDGWGIYCINGINLMGEREKIITEPKKYITVKSIDNEENAEIRRIMIEKFGESRYISESGIAPIHQDDFGILYQKELKNDEPLMMVKVVNSTAEGKWIGKAGWYNGIYQYGEKFIPQLDGEGNEIYKDYWIRIDPKAYGGIKTARAAVASTWRNKDNSFVFAKPEDYDPEIES